MNKRVASGSIMSLLVTLLPLAQPAPVPTITAEEKARLFEMVDLCKTNGRFRTADSLLGVLDRKTTLASDRLFDWAQISGLSADYMKAVGLYCRAGSSDPRFIDGAMYQLFQMLENAPPDTIATVCAAFQRCVLCVRSVDTFRIAAGLADFFDRHNMDSSEINLFCTMTPASPMVVSRLIGMARMRFMQGRYENALKPARIAYERTQENGPKADAAGLIYCTFQSMGKNDSALVWLDRAGISNDRRRIDAATNYQYSGRHLDAKKFIEKIVPSFSRDTLLVRQLLFSGDIKGAAEIVRKGGERWAARPQEWLLWRVRLLLFSSSIDELNGLLDSIKIEPNAPGAGEIIGYRYLAHALARSNQAMAVWSQIEFDFYLHQYEKAARGFAGHRLSPDMTALLAVRVIRELLAHGSIDQAAQLFALLGQTIDSPEYLYLQAETQLKTGRIDLTKALLVRLVRDFPDDVFSEKARIVLSQLQRTN